MLLRRLLLLPSRHLRLQTLAPIATTTTSSSSSCTPLFPPLPSRRRDAPLPSRPFSTSGGDDDKPWAFAPDSGDPDPFADEPADHAGEAALGTDASGEALREDPWTKGFRGEGGDRGGVFEEIYKETAAPAAPVAGEAAPFGGDEPWTLGGEEEDAKDDLFAKAVLGDEGVDGNGVGGGELEGIDAGGEDDEERQRQENRAREQELMETLKGPNRAFGDLIAASGITEDMIDSLILLKDVRNVEGLPPLSEIEDKAIQRLNATSSRAEVERKKQEEIAMARVRQVDEKGRAYGTGKRKCSIARVWIQPGSGKFVVNDKEFDSYFPILDHRADLLRPFTVTKTLGLWDVACTVKGGGVSGQVGAIRLGISRALQNWEPGLRPYLKAAGYLTRDARVVERKKPGKAKARKSFQWVKR